MAHKKITLWRSADSLAQNVKLEENNQTKNIWGNLYSESLLETSFPFFLYFLYGVVGGEVAQLGLVLVLAHQVQLARVAVLLLE